MFARLALKLEELRRSLEESGGKVAIYDDGGGFKEIFPDPYNQTYDSHLLAGAGNSKTVEKLAAEKLRVLAKMRDLSTMTALDVFREVDDYVMKHAKGKLARAVRWNSKSYPD
jgi:hypothetical protein